MIDRRKGSTILINGLFFGTMFLFLGIYYPNHLFQKEQMQMFLSGSDYLFQHVSFQGGFVIYLGEFLTQFFLFPWIGAAIVSLLIFSVYYSFQKILKLLFEERFNVLAFIPAIGYCFLLFNDFYCISGIIAIGIAMWSLVGYLRITLARRRMWAGILTMTMLYWFAGGAYILFGLSVIATELIFLKRKDKRGFIPKYLIQAIAGYIFVGIMVPLIAHKYIILDTLLQTYFSRAFYKFDLIIPTSVILIILSVPVFILFRWLLKIILPSLQQKIFQYVTGFFIVFFLGYGLFTFPRFDEEKEMKYDNLVYHQQWFEIIKNAEKDPPGGKQGRSALMLALGQTGQLSSRLFLFDPHPDDFFIPYEMHGMAPFIASEPYYYLGLNNFAQMLAMETIESTPDAIKPVRSVKRYVETCIINGQYDVAARYLRYLRRTLFHRKWANEALQYLINDKSVKAHPEWDKLRASQVKDDFYFQQEDQDMVFVSLLRRDTGNRLAYEYLMSSVLLKKDFDEFLKYLPLYKLMNYSEMPVIFQEALAYVETLHPESAEILTEFKISQQVLKSLEMYANSFKQEGNRNPALMKKSFGNTYWYYLHFSGSHEK